MQRITPRTLIVLLGLMLVYAVAASLVTNSYYQLQLTLIPLWACYALAWNILSGNSGLISFGHASFFGCGAYLVVLLAVKFGISPWISIPLALPMGGVLKLCGQRRSIRFMRHASGQYTWPLPVLRHRGCTDFGILNF